MPTLLPKNPADSESSASQRPPRRWLIRLLVVAVLLACLFLARHSILRSLASPLIIDDATSIEAVLIDAHLYEEAAEIQRQHPSCRFLIVQLRPSRLEEAGIRPTSAAVAQRELTSRGVPAHNIVVLPGPGRDDNSWDRARRLQAWLQQNPGQQVTILCRRFDSGHTGAVLDQVLDADERGRVHFRAIPHPDYDETNWWRGKRGILAFFRGWVGLAHVYCQGDDSAEWHEWDPDSYEQTLNRPK